LHSFDPLWLSSLKFHRRFRSDSTGWIYDPSLGRAPGRPVSEAEARNAKCAFDALHHLQDRRINQAAKIIFPALFMIPVVLLVAGLIDWLAAGLGGAIGTLLLIIALANIRLILFAANFWTQVKIRPETPSLSVEEQIRLGYRDSWGARLGFALLMVLIVPGYGYVHSGGHDYLALIPRIGPAVSYWYWLAAKLLGLVGLLALLGLLVRKVVIVMTKNRTPSNKPFASQRQSLDLPVHKSGLADLSGVEKSKPR
jgi:hypothetical protein